MSNYFEGWYFKHQKNDETLALIPGRSNDHAFIQVITGDNSYNIDYDMQVYTKGKKGDIVSIGGSTFSKAHMTVDIVSPQITLQGRVTYQNPVPLAYHIMGPFKYLPMQCNHDVLSMYHTLNGGVTMNGQKIDMTGGIGYIEADRGRSFPKSYTWVHSNDFDQPCSIMISIAHIPLAGFWFLGCISIIWYGGKEYRLSTYQGVKVTCNKKNRVELKQGRYHLSVELDGHSGHTLKAPDRGMMSRTIKESPAIKAKFVFWAGDKLIFSKISGHTSFEFVE